MNRIAFICLIFLPLISIDAVASNIACYYGTWAAFTPSAIPPNLCTSILVAFVQVKSDLQTIVPFEDNDLVSIYPQLRELRSQSTVGLKITIALGGATHNNSRIVSLTENEALLATFASNTVSQLRDWDMDGLDVDWEFPDSKISHNIFMTALRKAIDNEVLAPGAPRLELSAALPVGKQHIDPGYDAPTLANLIDIAYVMAYDFHGTWDPFTGHNSPLKARQDDINRNLNVQWSVEYWNQLGLPKSKLYVGMPTYGRPFQLTNSSNSGVGAPSIQSPGEILTYREICSSFLVDANTVQYWDAESQVPYAVKNDIWLSYPNFKSLRNKCEWVEDNQYAGAMVWSLHQDDYDGTCGEGTFPLVGALKSCAITNTTTGTTSSTDTSGSTSSTSAISYMTTQMAVIFLIVFVNL